MINSHEAPLPDGVQRIHADRREPGALAAALADHRDAFDAVFDHTAFEPADMAPLIELFRGRIQHYIFTSSQAVYRRSFVQPLREDFCRHAPDDAIPAKAYGVGKVQCEDHLFELFEREGFPATSLRVGHTLGPRSPRVTRDPWLFQRLEAGRPILVPGDGFATLSLVHINDVARLMHQLFAARSTHDSQQSPRVFRHGLPAQHRLFNCQAPATPGSGRRGQWPRRCCPAAVP